MQVTERNSMIEYLNFFPYFELWQQRLNTVYFDGIIHKFKIRHSKLKTCIILKLLERMTSRF